MNTTTLNKRMTTLAMTAAATTLLLATNAANAVPISGQYLEDARCDNIPSQHLTHELGQNGIFPINEALEINFQATQQTVCVPQDGLPNDWNVQIRNVSPIAWQDLFFVVDLGTTFGNADGSIFDAIGAPGVITDAMRIDGTVTLGVNNNLFFESGPVDEILQPGEIWRFNVSNFMNATAVGGFQPPIFVTPGIFAGSSPFGTTNGNASILANPVPEPGVMSLLIGGAAAMLLRRPGRRARAVDATRT
jgi:hypothetical protein